LEVPETGAYLFPEKEMDVGVRVILDGSGHYWNYSLYATLPSLIANKIISARLNSL
jgi:hypothetical protein